MLKRLRSVIVHLKRRIANGEKSTAASKEQDEVIDENTGIQRTLASLNEWAAPNICIYGQPGSGMKCLSKFFVQARYSPGYDPTGDDANSSRMMRVCEQYMLVQFYPCTFGYPGYWDERKGVKGLPFYIITYNVGDRTTFEKVDELHMQVLSLGARDRNGRVREWYGGMLVALQATFLIDQEQSPV